MSFEPTQPLPTGRQSPGYPPPRARRRRRRWPIITGAVVVLVIVLLVVADRVANGVAESQMASQFQTSVGLSGKPSVSIGGFPFLTQLLSKDFNTVNISASNESVNESNGVLQIASLTATLHGMHFQSLSAKSAMVDNLDASALVTLSALGTAGGIPQGITLSAAGSNEVTASIDIAGFSQSVTAKVTQSGSNQINVHVIDAGGIPTDILGNLANFNISIPKLPAGMAIQNVSVTQQGVQISITGHNVLLSQ
jgi:hypothetical protein